MGDPFAASSCIFRAPGKKAHNSQFAGCSNNWISVAILERGQDQLAFPFWHCYCCHFHDVDDHKKTFECCCCPLNDVENDPEGKERAFRSSATKCEDNFQPFPLLFDFDLFLKVCLDEQILKCSAKGPFLVYRILLLGEKEIFFYGKKGVKEREEEELRKGKKGGGKNCWLDLRNRTRTTVGKQPYNVDKQSKSWVALCLPFAAARCYRLKASLRWFMPQNTKRDEKGGKGDFYRLVRRRGREKTWRKNSERKKRKQNVQGQFRTLVLGPPPPSLRNVLKFLCWR